VTHVFVSHVSEETEIAKLLKATLEQDFLDLIKVFVSSDTDSIAAGEEWLTSIKRALDYSALLIIMCSPISTERPWINFEAGAAWMRGIPLVPLCHSGLTLRDLRMPLSLRQGAELDNPEGLKRLYKLIADVLKCRVPQRSFDDLVREIARSTSAGTGTLPTALTRERAIRKRLKDALLHHRFRWRTVERVAYDAALPEDVAADLLRADPEVRFAKGKSGKAIVGLRSRVGTS
jgi:hypothetical protein